MEIFAGLSVCSLVLVALVVASRTLLLWVRARGLPELLLSMMLFSATVLGYPVMIVSTQIPASDRWPVHLGAQMLFGFGYACLLLFTLKVFRPRSSWAMGLTGFTLLLIVVATGAYAVELSRENPREPVEMVGLTLFNTLPCAIAYLWTTLESLAYYRRLRLRIRLGLADVVVANRVLLWGLMCLAAGSAVVINMAALLAGSFMSPSIILVSSALGLAHAGCLFMAFHPPEWYTGWLERRQALEA